MNDAAVPIAIAFVVLLICLFLVVRRKWSATDKPPEPERPEVSVSGSPMLLHRLCPHSNVVQSVEVKEKDSLDEHLDLLTRKLAEKEGRLRLSKSKIRETQQEIENLHAIDHEVQRRYQECMDALRNDLTTNEKDCKKLQEQIEWVSRRRAELKEEVRKGQQLYGEAAIELASSLAELKRGSPFDHRVTDKPQDSDTSLRRRKEPVLPKTSNVSDPLKSLRARYQFRTRDMAFE